MLNNKEAFEANIQAKSPPLTLEQIKKAALFAEILHIENEKQNLTRIEGVDAFYFGHLIDVIELLKLPTLGNSVVDIGSGCGVPGLLAAAIDTNPNRKWHLIESELNKADFLSRTAVAMGLKNVKTYAARVENVISSIKPDTVIARAVGRVEKIASWIDGCSTWNNLILFKSRGWQEEWAEGKLTRFGRKLTVSHTHEYAAEDKFRILISLKK